MSEIYLPVIPAWRGDETCFSWCSAVHRLGGSGSAKRTSEQLFGIVHAARFVHMPRHLAHLCRVSRDLLGTPENILEERTLFSYIVKFRTAEQINLAMAGAVHEGEGTATAQAGQKLRGALRRPWLKACPACVRESRDLYGTAVWRRSHQLPMALLCLEHREPLHVWEAGRSLWFLPSDSPPSHTTQLNTSEEFSAAQRLTEVDHMLLKLGGSCNVDHFRSHTITALYRIGVIRAHRRIDENRLAEWIDTSKVWRVFRASMALQRDEGLGDLAEMLIRGRRQGHPALWSLIWAAISDVDRDAPTWLAAALAKDGVPTQLPLEFDMPAAPDLPDGFEATLMSSETLSEVARRLRVGVHTVRRWLDRHGELRLAWEGLREETRRSTAVSNIERFMRANPAASRSELLRACKTDASWLETHDAPALVNLQNTISSGRARQRPLFAPASLLMEPGR